MRMIRDDDGTSVGSCDVCGTTIERFRGQSGDLECADYGSVRRTRCPAIYNLFGQRLRDDLYTRRNPSEWDDDIDDLTGDELSYGTDR